MEALDFLLADQLCGLFLFCGMFTFTRLKMARADVYIGFTCIRRCNSRQNICSLCCRLRHL
jgi:hypothetical protein